MFKFQEIRFYFFFSIFFIILRLFLKEKKIEPKSLFLLFDVILSTDLMPFIVNWLHQRSLRNINKNNKFTSLFITGTQILYIYCIKPGKTNRKEIDLIPNTWEYNSVVVYIHGSSIAWSRFAFDGADVKSKPDAQHSFWIDCALNRFL